MSLVRALISITLCLLLLRAVHLSLAMAYPKILFISSLRHAETRAITEKLRSEEYVLVDDEVLKKEHSFELSLDKTGYSFILNNKKIVLSKIKSIFIRQIPGLSSCRGGSILDVFHLKAPTNISKAEKLFYEAEAHASLFGALFSSFNGLWVNNPIYDKLSDYKLYQLYVASKVGLQVPKTFISTDKKQLKSFWKNLHGGVISKSIVAFPSTYLKGKPLMTKEIDSKNLALLYSAPYSLVLFQELIPAKFDLRAIIVGNEVFCASIHSQEGKSKLDWRADYTVPFRPYNLNIHIKKKLLKVARELGLTYGAADLRVMPNGKIVFLEINSQGAFLFIEKLTGQKITDSIVKLLREGYL